VLTRKRLINKLTTLPLLIQQGVVFRFVHIKYQKTALSTEGSLKVGGRYNISQEFSPQKFSALYTSDSPVTALQELRLLVNTPLGLTPFKGEPHILLSLEYTLQSVLDLTDINHQKILKTNLQELTGDWLTSNLQDQIAPTQELAKAIYDLQTIEALKVPSSVNVNAYNLVIFPERLLPNSFIQVHDPSGTIAAKLP
jgi:RES domain-containing protein